MNPIQRFESEKKSNIKNLGKDKKLKELSLRFLTDSSKHKYSYNFTWLGRPIIQFPQDIIAIQELIFKVKPDLIIETGIAHGGSLILSASILELIGKGEVLGIDIDIRTHNKKEMHKHPLSKRIRMIEGSSVDEKVIEKVKQFSKRKKKIMVFLDSNHTHDHVLKELKLYSPFVSLNSYLVVFDTVVEDMPKGSIVDRPWGKGNNPKTAVLTFLKGNKHFVVDKNIENKLLITVAPNGYLLKVSR